MDIRIKQFTKIVVINTIVFLVIFIVLWVANIYIPVYFYKNVFIILAILFLALGLLFIIFSTVLIIIYKKKKVLIFPPKVLAKIFKIIYPLILSITNFFHYDKKIINQFFIYINNIFVESMNLKGNFKDILILAPHCIQNSSCNIKITSNSQVCIGCGKCKIYNLNNLQKKYKIKLAIATGGTLARKVIKECKPKYIIAIACERDLISGILDVDGIAVYGVLNKCPNGPCKNTTVDIKKVEDAIKNYILK
ncbi:DUF116 domain-containing protein [Defluviitalea phaphyphila]|uniref:DUF116 domain-containing protein n=1 Tax=Defluviitalea phaphyphila TaxID=1473580 RepID=UPI00072FF9CB|nr:DUF116 domain-containing protein [Defluviitalea phaphyphila]